jgi:hypothetical protein
MERGGTGFQTMMESYKDSPEHLQPVVSIHPGFLNLRLYDRLYQNDFIDTDYDGLTNAEKVTAILRMEGGQTVKSLEAKLGYQNRSRFLKEVLNPLIASGVIYKDGKPKSPRALVKLKNI